MMGRGEVLWQGGCGFPAATGADGAMRTIDVPALGVGSEERLLLSMRNGSALEDLAVVVGHVHKFRPFPRRSHVRRENTCQNSANTVTTVLPHCLAPGDRIAFEGDGGGVTANVYYYVIDSARLTDFVFQFSATPGGAAFNVDSDSETNAFDFVPSPELLLPSAAGVVATDVYETATPHGLTVGDTVMLSTSATVDCLTVFTTYYVIATPTTLSFQLSATRGGSTVNVGATTAVILKLSDEFVAVTSFTLAKWAAGTYLVNVAGMEGKVVQGWPLGASGGRITVSPGDQTYDAFWVSAEVRRA
jgi:hypothetical protein